MQRPEEPLAPRMHPSNLQVFVVVFRLLGGSRVEVDLVGSFDNGGFRSKVSNGEDVDPSSTSWVTVVVSDSVCPVERFSSRLSLGLLSSSGEGFSLL